MAKIVDVARRAGVSVGSVSRVINDHPTVSAATRERVETAVRELGYVPNAIAGSLRSRRSKTIGLIIPDVTNPFFSELALHVERSAAAAATTSSSAIRTIRPRGRSTIFARWRCGASTASSSCRREAATRHSSSKFPLSGWIAKSSGARSSPATTAPAPTAPSNICTNWAIV